MAWTVVSLAARTSRAVGVRRGVVSAPALTRATVMLTKGLDAPDVFARLASRRVAAMSVADRRAVDAAFAELEDHPSVVERALASGAPVSAVASLAGSWQAWDSAARRMVADPVSPRVPGRLTWGAMTPTQVDQTTCGAASLAMMGMIVDPLLAAWVATGQRGAYLPADALTAVIAADATSHGLHTSLDRWRMLQRVIHERATRWGLGIAPWPRSLGTPPWRADDVANLSGMRFEGALIDDARADEVAGFVLRAKAALSDGIPVPLYVGGDSSRGLSTVIPRHVVLLVAAEDHEFTVFEPSSGALHAWTPSVSNARREPALGNWNRIVWAVLPRFKRSAP